jgi:hypothetical protein
MWKRLMHPNIVPFTGVTVDPLQIASEWMPGGTLTAYVNSKPHADRVTLVGLLQVVHLPDTSPQIPTSWSMLQVALTTFTLTAWFMEILKG